MGLENSFKLDSFNTLIAEIIKYKKVRKSKGDDFVLNITVATPVIPQTIHINIFRGRENEFPNFSGPGDIIFFPKIKVRTKI